MIQATRTRPGEPYTIDRLPAGEYLVAAVDARDYEAWTDPEFLAAAAPQATRVTLDWGAERTLNLIYREVRR